MYIVLAIDPFLGWIAVDLFMGRARALPQPCPMRWANAMDPTDSGVGGLHRQEEKEEWKTSPSILDKGPAKAY